MFCFEFVKIFLFCFYLIIQIKSQLHGYYDSASYEDSNQETSNYIIGKDFGPCTCDLHRGLCDFDCCCDDDCDDDQKERFTFDCENDYHPKHINDKFKCQNLKKTYEFYKNRSHEKNVYSYHNNEDLNKYHDHIFGLMCMKYDRTGDIGEFYKEFEGDDTKKSNELDEYHNNYLNIFNKTIDADIAAFRRDNDIIKVNMGMVYKNVKTGINIYQSDAFGNCIKTLEINYLQPIENVECGMNVNEKNKQENYTDNFTNVECDNNSYYILYNNRIEKNETCNSDILQNLLMNQSLIIKEFFITIYYEEIDDEGYINFTTKETSIKSLFMHIPLGEIKRVKQKFNVRFIKYQSDSGQYDNTTKVGIPGYLINKPILFKINNKIYERIQIQGADPDDGRCLLSGLQNNIVNINDPFILFKVDTIYTCKASISTNDINNNNNFNLNYKIFNNFKEEDNIEYGKYGFIETKIGNNEDKIYNKFDLINFDNKCDSSVEKVIINKMDNSKIYYLPITQYLVIIVSKFGRKGSSQEYIYKMTLLTKCEPIEFNNDTKDLDFKFIVKFISLNEEQFERSFENGNYKTSLIPLPEDVKR